jgi:N-methylhydantoinase A
MEEELTDQFMTDGLDRSGISFQRSGDLRYVGQGYELRITFPNGLLDDGSLTGIFDQFHDQHRVEYGHDFPDSAIEIVNARVTGIGQMPKIRQPDSIDAGSRESALIKSGVCMFRVDNHLEEFDTAFYQREQLPLEQPIAGPAIIIQRDSTTVVPPENEFISDMAGNMIISIGEQT